MSKTFFRIADVRRLRRMAERARAVSETGPEGWSRSVVDPMALLAVFDALRIKPGWILQAYQFRSHGNGNGKVYALPEGADLSEPSDCPADEDAFLSPPGPPSALDDVMDAIAGDGTPWSFFSASLFAREISEFGAIWHGCHWSDEQILASSPFRNRESHQPGRRPGRWLPPGTPHSDWTWLDTPPRHWRPHLTLEQRHPTVTFLTLSELGQAHITRHDDHYQPSTCRSQTTTSLIAQGPPGFVY